MQRINHYQWYMLVIRGKLQCCSQFAKDEARMLMATEVTRKPFLPSNTGKERQYLLYKARSWHNALTFVIYP